jgi:3D (Asp-Asp-Asp) domain-containing protein
VDPGVIPLGSRVYVPGWGWRTADDTGAAIKGRRVDVRLGSRGSCNRLGVQRKTIKFIRPSFPSLRERPGKRGGRRHGR